MLISAVTPGTKRFSSVQSRQFSGVRFAAEDDSWTSSLSSGTQKTAGAVGAGLVAKYLLATFLIIPYVGSFVADIGGIGTGIGAYAAIQALTRKDEDDDKPSENKKS